MTTFWCPSDILITSWLFTAQRSMWLGNHLVPCVAELVGSCIPIHAHQCLPDPKCLFYPSGLSLCLSVNHFCLVPVDDMVLFHSMADLWVTLLSLALEAQVCVPAVKESTSIFCFLILRSNFLPVSPTYELEQFLQGTRYINSVFSSSLTLSFGWTTKFRSVRWAWLAVVMPWDFRILANASLSPFTYGTTIHIFVTGSSGRHQCAWIGMQNPTNSATHETRWFPGHVLHQAVNNQDVIKMSDGHRKRCH